MRPSARSARLPGDVQGKMERSFGVDFGGVRVSASDPGVAQRGAQAQAQGEQVAFAPGHYNPGTAGGDALIGHELAHVVQQRAGRVELPQGAGSQVNQDPSLEREADVAGDAAARGEAAHVTGATSASTAGLAGPVQAKLDGSAGALLARGGASRGRWRTGAFSKIRQQLEAYEEAERGVLAGQSLPLQRMLLCLKGDIDRYLASHDDQDQVSIARKQALSTLKTRVEAELAEIRAGRFAATPVRSDRNLRHAEDNKVGGALNKLDYVRYGAPDAAQKQQTPGFYKPESYTTDGSRAGQVGIPDVNPNFSGRSVASNVLDSALTAQVNAGRGGGEEKDSELLAKSEFATHDHTTPSGQKAATSGLFMEMAKGDEMRGGLIGKGKLAAGASGGGQTGTSDPMLQRSLNKLQWLDALCGQIDRHNANFFIERSPEGRVQRVTGIDNDLAFGKDLLDPRKLMDSDIGGVSPWCGLPPLADEEYADALLALTPAKLREALGPYLGPAEVDAAISRLQHIKAVLSQMKAQGKIISRGDWSVRAQELSEAQINDTEGRNYLKEIADELYSTTMGAGAEVIMLEAWQTEGWEAIERLPDGHPEKENSKLITKFAPPRGEIERGLRKLLLSGKDIPASAVNFVIRRATELYFQAIRSGALNSRLEGLATGTRPWREALMDGMTALMEQMLTSAIDNVPNERTLAYINAADDLKRAEYAKNL